jgi:hypothetical protein
MDSDTANATNTTHTPNIPEATDATQPVAIPDAAEPTDHEDASQAANAAEAAVAENPEDTVAAADTEDTDNVLVDTVDTNLFETLVQDFHHSTAPEQDRLVPPDRTQTAGSQLSDPVLPPPVHVSRGNSNTAASPTLIVDRFPRGSPGAPIPGSHPGSHIYQSSQDAFGPRIWAPFRSQHDWEIAHWAKTCRPTSSALAELLAIPKVCTRLLLLL